MRACGRSIGFGGVAFGSRNSDSITESNTTRMAESVFRLAAQSDQICNRVLPTRTNRVQSLGGLRD